MRWVREALSVRSRVVTELLWGGMTRPSVMMITILILVGTLALISASTIKGRICDRLYSNGGREEEKSPGPSVTGGHSIQFNEKLCLCCSLGWELHHPSIWWIPPSTHIRERNLFQINSIFILSPLNYCQWPSLLQNTTSKYFLICLIYAFLLENPNCGVENYSFWC